MSYRLSPLNGLCPSEAATPDLSFRHASGEQGVTPSTGVGARPLGQALGVALFRHLLRLLVTKRARLAKRTGFAGARKPEDGRLVYLLKDLPKMHRGLSKEGEHPSATRGTPDGQLDTGLEFLSLTPHGDEGGA
jgi:hypothetical protein